MHSSFAIILKMKMKVDRFFLFFVMSCYCMRCVIVVCPDQTYLLFGLWYGMRHNLIILLGLFW